MGALACEVKEASSRGVTGESAQTRKYHNWGRPPFQGMLNERSQSFTRNPECDGLEPSAEPLDAYGHIEGGRT